jgi:predicted transcriptional regulator
VPQEPLERLVQLGLAERKVNRFKLTPKGRVVLRKLG